MQLTTVLFLFIALYLLIAFVIAFKRNPSSNGFTYTLRGSLFSAAERSFCGVLTQAVSDQTSVFGKVRVADILTPDKDIPRNNWEIASTKISAKHFDFVLCSKDQYKIIAVIELDDMSHNSKKAKLRDSIIENACKTAMLPLIRFKARSSYDIGEVREQIIMEISKGMKTNRLPRQRNVPLETSADCYVMR